MRTVKAYFKATRALQTSPLLTLEIAHTPEQRERGLMARAHLPRNQGMLFVFEHAARHGFWMKNTGIPLDIAWLSPAGIVQECQLLHPLDETLRLPKQEARYALELCGGALAHFRVRVGDQLVLCT